MFQTRGIRPRLMRFQKKTTIIFFFFFKKKRRKNHHKDFQESCILLYTRGIHPWLIFQNKKPPYFKKKKIFKNHVFILN